MDPNPDNVRHKTTWTAYLFLIIGAAMFAAAYLQVSMWSMVGNNLAKEIRIRFFRAVLRQELAFHDATDTGKLTTHLSADTQAVQNGVSEKIGQSISLIAQLAGGIGVAFWHGWKLTLILLAVSPVVSIAGYLQFSFIARGARQSTEAFSTAGSKAVEVFGAIRTVYAFNREPDESRAFEGSLNLVQQQGIKNGFLYSFYFFFSPYVVVLYLSLAHWSGFGFGISMFAIFGVYALGFWRESPYLSVVVRF